MRDTYSNTTLTMFSIYLHSVPNTLGKYLSKAFFSSFQINVPINSFGRRGPLN